MGDPAGDLRGHTDMDSYSLHLLIGRLCGGPSSRSNVYPFREVLHVIVHVLCQDFVTMVSWFVN